MPILRFAVDKETYEALCDHATRHLRPTDHHAAALLRQALGLPFPLPGKDDNPSAYAVAAGAVEGR
jgi:hypothetical protein